MVQYNKADLEFILTQINIGEDHAAFIAANQTATTEQIRAFLANLAGDTAADRHPDS